MEKAFRFAISEFFRASPRAPYYIAAAFVVLGLLETWQIYTLHAELMTAREIIRTRDWQVTEDSARKSLADVHLVFLDNKDPAYASARIVVAWNGVLHQGIATLQNLPDPPPDHAYQLWVLDPGGLAPVNAGILKTLRDGSQSFSVLAVTTRQVGFAVTLEPTEGSPEPTSRILFAVAPAQ